MVEIHQFVQSFVRHDAISNHVVRLRRLLHDMGVRSEIYAGEQQAGRSAATYFREFAPGGPPSRTWMLYHFSTGSPIAAFLAERPEHVALHYHNVTPAEIFGPWEPTVGVELEAARRQLASLAPVTELAIGVSRYNEDELRRTGYKTTDVAPVLFDPATFEHELDAKASERLQKAKAGGGADWLFVGRVSPNKAQQDIIKAFALYKRLYDPNARLHLVGKMSSHRYWTVLERYIDALQLRDSVRLTGGVSDGELGAYYRNADVFVCLSDHEGFGVPLLEAMYNSLPIVAFRAAAVPETVGSAAVLLDDKSPGRVAAAVNRVLADGHLRRLLVGAGTARLTEFSPAKSEGRWRAVVESMVERAS